MLSKLYLHVGHGKTGSSYIQSCLAKSKSILDKNKICYPISEQERLKASMGGISSGNGSILVQDNYYNVIKESINSNHDALLFSDETLMSYLCQNTNDVQKNIHKIVELNGIKEINILLFIRNPLEFVSSVYQQAVKRSNWYLDIDDYLDYYAAHFGRVLDFLKLITQWGNISLKILNYSYCKHNIIIEIENWLHLDKIKLDLPDVSVINRSLTKGEIELQKSLNKNLRAGGGLLADPLCEKLPNIPSDVLALSSCAKKIFLEKIEPIMMEINSMVDPKHRLSLQDSEGDTQYEDQFVFSKDQVRVIGESFSYFIANQREEINMLRESQHLLMSSLPFRISRKLNSFPRIKKLIKILCNYSA